jgi:hypothetical protein
MWTFFRVTGILQQQILPIFLKKKKNENLLCAVEINFLKPEQTRKAIVMLTSNRNRPA